MHLDRSLGNYGLKDDVSGRRNFALIMQKRAAEVANSENPRGADARWEEIRRGWCFGADSFRDEMVESLDKVLEGKNRESFVGDETRKHDELDAERRVVDALELFEWKDVDLAGLKKGDPQKKVIAWLVRKNTGVRNAWIAERLCMGNPSSLPRQVREVDMAENGELFRLREMTK